MLIKGRPENYVAPHLAYTSIFPADWQEVCLALIGVQSAPGGQADELASHVMVLLNGAHGVLHFEQSNVSERFGHQETAFACYWRDRETYVRWAGRPDVIALFEGPLPALTGLWREQISTVSGNVDPNYSMEHIRWGFGRYVDRKPENEHFYYGSMRVRMPNNATFPKAAALPLRFDAARKGDLITATSDDPICVIRSCFGWSACSTEQQLAFVDIVYPAYVRAVDFLSRHSQESGCLSARLCTELPDATDKGIEASFFGYFTSIDALENWVHHHPTHDAIISAALQVMTQFEFKMPVNLGHEVYVVEPEGLNLLYNSCHPHTGLMPSLTPK
jgi:aldoxime dehydratase